MDWKKCDNWKDLPEGTWLTKMNSDYRPYNIAEVTTKTGDGHKMIIVGNHFHWDMGKLIAYTAFPEYDG